MTIREKLYHIVFKTDTKAGRRFDIILLWTILISVIVVMVESVPEIGTKYVHFFFTIEWLVTIIFAIEYILRIWISPRPLKYITSFWGIVDLLSVLPTFLGFFWLGYHYFIIVRIFRLLRVFRILKIARFNTESTQLVNAFKSSVPKLSIFLTVVVSIVILMGTLMYVVEGGEKGFTSIPQSIYWAIVTVTTVGYGDMVPQTFFGKFLSSVAMITGYAIIAVPTGILTIEMQKSYGKKKICAACAQQNEEAAAFCNECGEKF